MLTQSLLISIAISNLMLAGLMLLFSGAYRSGHLSVKIWTLARVLQGLGFFLVAQRGSLGYFWSYWIGNAGVILGWWLEVVGTWGFLERRLRLAQGLTAGLVSYLLFAAISYRWEQANIRIIFPTVLSILIFGLLMLGFLREWRKTGSRLAAYLTGFNVLLIAGRLPRLWAAVFNAEFTVLSSDMLQTISYGALYLALLCNGFGFLLLSNEKPSARPAP
ncbi:MAG: hypothetical protein MO847_08420 [Candidatus Protistobacter heckmanni]|nr:hypothetical protein [Candidatus Protistobacter heckmanni]